jgi:glucose-1-phosphate adenylyltransferase
VISRAILDKDVRIGANVRITNDRRLLDGGGEGFVIREGIIVIPKGAVLRDGTVI